ncbi:formate dehydrogenase subunit gamma [Humitalea sp. 24SJ18S-53]|uniref:formate dehydrogenase subunit gamma n=1 Tax=Humitalea sp. 24SJ18S-53 TaxID=3422307 RepID=UPI003D670B26
MRKLLLILALLALPLGAATAQPAPTPFNDRGQLSAAELELQAALRGDIIQGRVTIPNTRAGDLIQPAGRDWRQFHNVTLVWVAGIAIVGMIAVLLVFYMTRGRIPIEGGPSGRTLQRFNWFERANHWLVASCFIVLGLSGLNLTFGRHLLLPLFGPAAFAEATHWGKIAHNFLSFPFTLGIALMFLLWVKDNIPNRMDFAWIKAGGGIIGNAHPPSGRFNAGQKMVFWMVVLGGAAVAVSGYFLIFPFAWTNIEGMQLAHAIHAVLSVLMIAAILAHIYIGSIGMEGAFDAMGTGQVDYNWARMHHDMWVDQELAKARVTIDGAAGAASAG